MARRGDQDDAVPKCAQMPFEDAVNLFFPTSGGGQLRRTRAWPGKDAHQEARAVCRGCGALASCLEGALEDDAWTFRGAMSAEERAVFGGFRDRDARRRPVYLSAGQVAARLREAGIDLTAVGEVLAAWQQQLTQQEPPDGEDQTFGAQAEVSTDPQALTWLADQAAGETQQAGRRVS